MTSKQKFQAPTPSLLAAHISKTSLAVATLALCLVMGTGSAAQARGTASELDSSSAALGSDSQRPSHSHPAPGDSVASGPINNLDTCFSPDEGCDQKLISFIQSARSTLDIAIYSITHEGITAAITDAKARGVTVRMVVDRREAKGKGSAVGTLVSGGISLKIGNVHGIMHDKFTIVDGAMIETGSYNYSMNATAENAENQIYLTDSNVIQKYQGNFERLWSNGLSD